MSFLENYFNQCKGDEAPFLYHQLTGFSLMSSLVGRRIWINQGRFTYYPNLYILLVGPAGGGKSAALDEGKAFLRAMKTLPLSADSETVQSLLRKMTKEEEGKVNRFKKTLKYDGKIIEWTPVNIIAGEFVSFIGMDPYGWITFLTTIYHENIHEVDTKNMGCDALLGPFVNLLGCLTPETQDNLLQQKIVASGFARRTIHVWASGRGTPIPFPDKTPEQLVLLQECLNYGVELQRIEPGPMIWTPEAKDWYSVWYCNLQNNLQDGKIGTAVTEGYYRSKHMQLLKLGMLWSLSESTKKVLRVDHLTSALYYLDEAEKGLDKVFAGTGANRNASIAEKIMGMLEGANRVFTMKEVFRTMYREAQRDDIEKIIHHLTATDRIIKWERQNMGELVATPEAYRAYKVKTEGQK